MSATLKAKSSKTVILFSYFFFSVADFKFHNILTGFQKHVNQDLLLHWQEPETSATVPYKKHKLRSYYVPALC